MSALEEVFRAYHGRLCAFVRHQVGSMETAEELVQDVFLRVWEGRARLDANGSLRSLLYRSARNAALNHLKHRAVEERWRRAASLDVDPARGTAEDAVREHELAAAIDRTIAALPERCRLIFLMSRQQGLGYAEIAEILGLSVKTVETQMGRALKALRAGLAAFLG
ncbi:MAG: RNA polymerase sigma-70 factor [Gemmatimonadetes bacterium]|nr:RNA polymerase sigma-70 factor [Gemmatimonadota bacterium]